MPMQSDVSVRTVLMPMQSAKVMYMSVKSVALP
jgi:hypothetical protein